METSLEEIKRDLLMAKQQIADEYKYFQLDHIHVRDGLISLRKVIEDVVLENRLSIQNEFTRCDKLSKEFGVNLHSLKIMENVRKVMKVATGFFSAVTELLPSMSKKDIDDVFIRIYANVKWVSQELLAAKEKLITCLAVVVVSFFKMLPFMILLAIVAIIFVEEIKHGTSLKVTRLVLYNCGDIERNPGPVLRDFRKSQQTPFLHMIYQSLKIEPPKLLYSKGPPSFWDQFPGVIDADFFNISNVEKYKKETGKSLTEKDSENCFQRIIDILCICMKEDMSDDLKNVLSCYQTLTRKEKGISKQDKESKDHYDMCQRELQAWISRQKTAKLQKGLSTSKSNTDFEVCLQHQIELVQSGNTLSTKAMEMMQKLLNLAQSQNNTKESRKRKREDFLEGNITPSNPKYSRQDCDFLKSYEASLLDFLESDSLIQSSSLAEVRSEVSKNVCQNNSHGNSFETQSVDNFEMTDDLLEDYLVEIICDTSDSKSITATL